MKGEGSKEYIRNRELGHGAIILKREGLHSGYGSGQIQKQRGAGDAVHENGLTRREQCGIRGRERRG